MRLQARRDTIWLAVALALALGVFAVAGKARGEEPGPVPIAVGAADWGLKESFRNYIEGSIAHGSIAVADGATRNGDGSFHFPLLSGTYDPGTKSTAAHFGGSVHFSGHNGELDMTLTDLAVEITPEGADLFADVLSKSLTDGALVSYPNVNLADLDPSGVVPTIAAGTTTWPAIPATLTAAGVPAFANFYTPGQALDSFDFSYEGPGGKPTPETWTAPGTPGYEQLAAEASNNGTQTMLVDRAHGLLHAVSATGVRALGLQTLAQQGSLVASAPQLTPNQNGYAFDPENATVFAAPNTTGASPIRAFTWNDTTHVYQEATLPISGTKTTQLAYEPDKDTLYAIEGTGSLATPEGGTLSPTVAVAVRNGAGWTTPGYPSLLTGGRGVNGLARTSDGRLVATLYAHYIGTLAPANIHPTPAVELTDTGSSLTVTQIAGTTPAIPAGTFTYGYMQPVAGPGGTVLLTENSPLAPTLHAVTLSPQPGGFAVSAPVDIGASASIGVVDGTKSTVYELKPQLKTAAVVDHGAVVATLSSVPQGATEFVPTKGAASDGVLYFHNNSSPVKIFAYRHNADSPAIDKQPADATATLASADGSAAVSLTAVATADPAPSVQWQVRKPGSVEWTDVAGATAPTLAVAATADAAGNRYRAVFSNSAGQIATRVATLAVRVVPEKKANPTPPVVNPSPPVGTMPQLRLAGAKARVFDRRGKATLFTVGCPGSLPCVLQAPEKTRLRIAGERYWAKVIAPGSVLAGGWAKVQLKLPPPARAAIADGQTKATIPFTVTSGTQQLTQKLTVALRGPGGGGH